MKDRKDPRAAPGPRQRAFQRFLNRAAAYGLIAAPVCSLVLSPETQLIALAAFGVPMLFLSAAMTTMRPTTARLIPSLAEMTRSDPLPTIAGAVSVSLLLRSAYITNAEPGLMQEFMAIPLSIALFIVTGVITGLTTHTMIHISDYLDAALRKWMSSKFKEAARK